MGGRGDRGDWEGGSYLDEDITLTPRGVINKSGGGQDKLVEIDFIVCVGV